MIKKINSYIVFYLFFSISFLIMNSETACQETLGESLYDNHCSDCHSLSLRGSAHGSSLIGREFISKWEKDGLNNLFKYTKISISDVSNLSINETLARTIITSVTTLLALLSIYILGGEILRGFSFAMILGVLIGTYSSIFVASPVLKFFKVSYKTLEKEDEKIVP